MSENDQDNPAPEATDSTGPRKRRPVRLLFRLSVRLGVYTLLMLVTAGVVIGFTPVSSRWFDDLAREAVFDATGLRLGFLHADWMILPGVARLEGVALADPATGENLLRLKAVEVNLNMAVLAGSLRRGPLVFDVQRIAADGPVIVQLEQGADRMTVGGGLGTAERILIGHVDARAREKAVQPPVVRFGQVSLNGADVRLIDATREEPRELLHVVKVDVAADFGGTAIPQSVICMGLVEGEGDDARFNITLNPASDLNSTSLTLKLAEFDTRRHFGGVASRDIVTSSTTLRGRLSRESDGSAWELDLDASNRRITLVGLARDGSDEQLNEVALKGNVRWNPVEKTLRARIDTMKSREGELTGAVSVTLDGAHPFDAVVSSLVLHDESLQGLERVVFSERYLAEGLTSGATIELGGGMSGSLRDLQLNALNVHYKIAGVNLVFPEIPEPVRRISLQGTLTERQFTLAEGSAVFQGVPVKLRGGIQGDLLKGGVESGEINWESKGEVEGISNLISEATEGDGWRIEFAGDVKSKGAVRFGQKKPARAIASWADLMDAAELDGELRFNKAEVRFAELKEPIRDLKGTALLKGAELKLAGVSGSIKGLGFAADGTLRGSRYFWRDSALDMKLSATGRLERIEDYLGVLDEKLPKDWPRDLKGVARIEGALKGALNDPRAMIYRGTASLKDFEIGVKSEETTGTLRLPAATVEFTPAELKIGPTDGFWGGVPLTLQAGVTPKGAAVSLKAEAGFKEFTKVLPYILRDFEVDGLVGAEYSARIKADSPVIRKARTFVDLIPRADEAGTSTTTGWADGIKWSVEDGGRIIARDVDFTLDKMPTRLDGITGEVRYANMRLWTEQPLALNAGEHARATRAGFSMNIPRPDEPLDLQIELTGDFVDLDDWLQDWRDGVTYPDRRPATTRADLERLREKISVNFATKGVKFRGAMLEDFSGSLVYENRKHRRDNLRWDNVKARQGEGDIEVRGYWRMWDSNEMRVYDIGVRDMAVTEVMQAFFDETERGGLNSGRVTGRLHLEQSGRGSPPYNGFGSFKVRDSRFVSNAVLGQLGQALGLQDIFGDITFNTIEGRFDVENSAVVMKGPDIVTFENPSLIYPLNLKVTGEVGPSERLNLDISLQFLPQVNRIPIIGAVWKVVNGLTGRILRYQVGGTIKEPRVNVLPRLTP